jgi:predicted AlkP superfamily pyrophosphatase or phosphodiesterase
MKKFLYLILLLCVGILSSCRHAEEKWNSNHYTVIVSLDGFRWDYPNIHHTPFLDTMAVIGVEATMFPSYPASTFPNHYTIATGLVPDHNGIVNNAFWDRENDMDYSMVDSITRNNPDYYLGEPIWTTAQRQGVKTGNVYWVGSDIPIKNSLPTYHRVWADAPRLTFEQRVDEVIRLLSMDESERPKLVMAYFDEPDHTGHVCGPRSVETGSMVAHLDSLMSCLWHRIQSLPIKNQVNLIITADHGMTDVSDDRFICVDDYVKPEWYDKLIGATPTSIFTKPEYRDSVYNTLQSVEHVTVWRKEEVPAELMYGSSDRLGDIIVAPELGWQFDHEPRHLNGAHGYFPQSEDMQVMFRAVGPDFKCGYKSESFVNVDIYTLLSHLLGVQPNETDGQWERVKCILLGE